MSSLVVGFVLSSTQSVIDGAEFPTVRISEVRVLPWSSPSYAVQVT